MKIHEYQAKDILERYGVAVPKGEVANTFEEAVDVAKRLFSGGATTNSSPALGSDGTIYFGAGNHLFAVRDTGFSGEKKWDFAAAGSDARFSRFPA